VERSVFGLVNQAHPAAPQFFQNAKVGEFLHDAVISTGRLLIQFNSFSSEKERYDCQNQQASYVAYRGAAFGLTNRYQGS
jgi:hypothetical protein